MRLAIRSALAAVLLALPLLAQEPPRGVPEHVTRPDHVEISTGDVVLRTLGNRTLVMVDTVLDRSVPSDGLIDQWFILESAETPVPLFVHLPDALVAHSAGVLRVTTADSRFELVLADEQRRAAPEANTTRVVGIGLSHNTAKTAISIAAQLDRRGNVSTNCDACPPLDPDPGTGGSGGASCSSGGPGSTSCSVTSNGNSCSVACATGYYACCNGVAGATYCRCVRG